MYAFLVPISSAIIGLLCGLVLNLAHILFSIYLQLKFCKFIFLKLLYNAKNFFTEKPRKEEFEKKLIEESVKAYSKLPKHLTYAVGEDKVSYEDLVQLIVWCLPAGVPVISFYDHRNSACFFVLQIYQHSIAILLTLCSIKFSFSVLVADKLHNTFLKSYSDLESSIKWGVSFSQDDEEKFTKYGKFEYSILFNLHSQRLILLSP